MLQHHASYTSCHRDAPASEDPDTFKNTVDCTVIAATLCTDEQAHTSVVGVHGGSEKVLLCRKCNCVRS